jgi:hypothetical protein
MLNRFSGLRLRDLKRNPHLASNVFNTVFHLDKYLVIKEDFLVLVLIYNNFIIGA